MVRNRVTMRVELTFLLFTSLMIMCLFSQKSNAKSVNLQTKHITVTTSFGALHAEIHFDERDIENAVKAENIIKNDLIKVVNYFEYVPRTTVHFNLDPYMRLTNGNARVFPTSIINLYQFPPAQNDHLIILEDWLQGLIFHEYIHITHLDQTRDFLAIGETIFGSIAKVPTAVVPRWFTEGIAVWGESHLIKGGRLHQPLFKKEFSMRMKDPTFCQRIDCLDEPGVYPHGSFSYWAGAHFIEFLENKKAGTVKCLVEENSGSLPFFLNRVFEKCTGLGADLQFDLFKDQLRSQLLQESQGPLWGEELKPSFGVIDYQKGLLTDGKMLYLVERNKKSEALVLYDTELKQSLLKNIFSFPINDLSDVFKTEEVVNEDGEKEVNKMLIVSFTKDANFRKVGRSWSLINAETLIHEKDLHFQNDPSYVLYVDSSTFITASYLSNRWVIERQQLSPAGIVVENKRLLSLGREINLVSLKRKGNQFYLKLNRGNVGSALYVTTQNFAPLTIIFESNDVYDAPYVSDKNIIIRDSQKLTLIEFAENINDLLIKKTQLPLESLKGVALIEKSEQSILSLESGLKVLEESEKDFIKKLKLKSQDKNESFLSASQTVNFSDEKVLREEEKQSENYPQLYHFSPHYWFLATGTNDNVNSFGAMTTFSDPMENDVISATALVYPEVSKFGGSLEWIHKLTSLTDLLSTSLILNEEFSQTDVSQVLNESQEGTLGVQYLILLNRLSLVPRLYLGQTVTKDFLSNRKVTLYGASFLSSFDALSNDDLWQNLSAYLRIQNDTPKTSRSYLNLYSYLNAQLQLQERVSLTGKFSYGKLVKDGFSQGVIYGGGVNSVSTNRNFEFYGLPYSNAYGNEIFSLRTQFDFNLVDIYKGYMFVPLFLKEIHLLIGSDFLASDRIFISGRTYRDESIQSFYTGPRFKTNLFYYAPTDIDVIYSMLNKPSGGSVHQLELNINADLF